MPLCTPPRSGGEVSLPGGSGDPKGSWQEKAEADTGASVGEKGSRPAALGGCGRAVLASELLLCSALGSLPWTPDPQLLGQQPLTEGVVTVPASLETREWGGGGWAWEATYWGLTLLVLGQPRVSPAVTLPGSLD